MERSLYFDRFSLNCDQSLKMLTLFYSKNGFPPSGTMNSFDLRKECVVLKDDYLLGKITLPCPTVK